MNAEEAHTAYGWDDVTILAGKPGGGKGAAVVHGTVESGLGEGRYFMSQKEYVEQIRAALKFTPYPGTLNINVDEKDLGRMKSIKSSPGIMIHGFERDGKHFGDAALHHAEVSGVKCAVVVPRINRHHGVLELIAKGRLRDALKLSDGSKVTVIVFPEK